LFKNLSFQGIFSKQKEGHNSLRLKQNTRKTAVLTMTDNNRAQKYYFIFLFTNIFVQYFLGFFFIVNRIFFRTFVALFFLV